MADIPSTGVDPNDVDPADRAYLQDVLDIVRGEVRKNWLDVRSCIATSRVLCIVLRSLGIKAKPQPVALVVFNAAAWREYNTNPDRPPADWPDEAWSIGTNGSGTLDYSTGGWNGHLAVVAEYGGRRWLLDGSLDQLSRPHRELHLRPAVIPLAGPWTGDFLHMGSADGMHLIYGAMEDPGPWRTARDWHGHSERVHLASSQALDEIERARLGSGA